MKPIIGITPSYSYEDSTFRIHEDYARAITAAGGTPILLFPSDSFPDYVQGIVLSGGGDLDPLLFGEEPLKENGEICPLRDEYELNLCRNALERNIPILGICRGMQILSIASGGKILQDIYAQTNSKLKHTQKAPRFYGTHTVEVVENSILYSIFQKQSVVVNSYHHQGISSAGDGFIPCGFCTDGLIEAIEHTKKLFAVGVQWHPEAMRVPEQQALFSALVQKATEYISLLK